MKGTAKELVEQGLTCNGVAVTTADLSILAKLRIIDVVDQQRNASGKGKPANVYGMPFEALVGDAWIGKARFEASEGVS